MLATTSLLTLSGTVSGIFAGLSITPAFWEELFPLASTISCLVPGGSSLGGG